AAPPYDPNFVDWRTSEGAPEIALLDEDIDPDPGNVNPFVAGADRNAKRRHYHVSFELSEGQPVELNPKAGIPPYRARGNSRMIGVYSSRDPGTGPLQLGGTPGTHGPQIWMRIYAPDHYEPTGGVALPTIRIQRPGSEPELAPPIQELWYNWR